MEYKVIEAWGAVTIAPCPFCEAERRHVNRDDPRGPISLLPHGYHCHSCGRGGPRAELEGLELSKEQEAGVHAHSKELPPRENIERFWSYCEPLKREHREHEYLRRRLKVDLLEVPSDLARRLPDFAQETQEIAGWKQNRRLVFALRDGNGDVRSVLGRNVAEKPRIKSLSLSGFGRAGLFLADAKAYDSTLPLVVTEGELDFLAWSLLVPEPHGTVGIFSGSLTDTDFFAKIRYRHVIVATDLDEAGEAYAEKLLGQLNKTCKVERWQPQKTR